MYFTIIALRHSSLETGLVVKLFPPVQGEASFDIVPIVLDSYRGTCVETYMCYSKRLGIRGVNRAIDACKRAQALL